MQESWGSWKGPYGQTGERTAWGLETKARRWDETAGTAFRVQPHLAPAPTPPAPTPAPTPDPSLASRETKPARRCGCGCSCRVSAVAWVPTGTPNRHELTSTRRRKSRQTGCVRVSVCPEGGGYTCSLLVAEEKGDLIGSQRGAGQAGTCSFTRSDSLLVVCSLAWVLGCLGAWLLGGSVTRSA